MSSTKLYDSHIFDPGVLVDLSLEAYHRQIISKDDFKGCNEFFEIIVNFNA